MLDSFANSVSLDEGRFSCARELDFSFALLFNFVRLPRRKKAFRSTLPFSISLFADESISSCHLLDAFLFAFIVPPLCGMGRVEIYKQASNGVFSHYVPLSRYVYNLPSYAIALSSCHA